jgi:hypothetical protein
VPKALVFAAAAGAALVVVGAVLAGNPGKEKIARTPAGNAQAKTEVLHRADLGPGWTGGFKKPDLSSTLPCSYHPKQSDLVVIGAAETRWEKSITYEIDSEADVLRTATMVRKDWRRTVVAPQVLPCLRQAFTKLLGSRGSSVSVRRVAFPHLTTYTRAFRVGAVIQGANGPVRFESNFLAMGAGRSEVSLTLTAFGKNRAPARAATLRLARILAHRMHS